MMLQLLPLLLLLLLLAITPVGRLHLPSGLDTMLVLLLLLLPPPLTVPRHRAAAGVIHLLHTAGMTAPLLVGYRHPSTLLPGVQM